MKYVFINPLSNNKKGNIAKNELLKMFSEKDLVFCDITTIENVSSSLQSLNEDDEIIIAGGDGTLTRFVNDIYNLKLKQNIYLFPCGSGNDFYNDIKENFPKNEKLILINKYFETLPQVFVNGINRHFINGIGCGIDGYCCEVGDKIRETSNKEVNYTIIALIGLLFKYKPCNAKITVDGVTKEYTNVWLSPTMIGRFYGGGMMITPEQERLNKEQTVSSGVCFCKSKLKILSVFPKIFKGTHISHTEIYEIRKGKEVTVELDRPVALQIDGETVTGVTSYTVKYN